MAYLHRPPILESRIPCRLKLLGTGPLNAKMRSVSLQGITTELRVIVRNSRLFIQQAEELIDLVPFLLSNEKVVEVDIEIPPKGEGIRATGRVVWYDFGSRSPWHYFRAGIFLEKMGLEDRKSWTNFVRHMAAEQKKAHFSPSLPPCSQPATVNLCCSALRTTPLGWMYDHKRKHPCSYPLFC